MEKIVNIICGWCRKPFYRDVSKNKDGEYSILTCPNCARVLPASKKVIINSVGKQHIHEDYEDGDVA